MTIPIIKAATISKYLINESFTLSPNEKRQVPFSFQLPFETPLTYGQYKSLD